MEKKYMSFVYSRDIKKYLDNNSEILKTEIMNSLSFHNIRLEVDLRIFYDVKNMAHTLNRNVSKILAHWKNLLIYCFDNEDRYLSRCLLFPNCQAVKLV
jgi:hypothetical protein